MGKRRCTGSGRTEELRRQHSNRPDLDAFAAPVSQQGYGEQGAARNDEDEKQEGERTEQSGHDEPSLALANGSREVEQDLHYRPEAHHAEPHDPTVLSQFKECPFRHFEIRAQVTVVEPGITRFAECPS